MSKVLVVDNDSVSGILTADRLRAEGFLVALHDDVTSVASRAVEEHADAVVVGVSPSPVAFDVLAGLRKDPRTDALPILLLLDDAKPGEGVRALREGANHYLVKPYDPEELGLRVHRLVSTRSPGRLMLEGDLSYYPFWELLQFLHQGAKSGRLTLGLKRKPADLTLLDGKLHEARYGRLRGVEAVIGLHQPDEGHFRFVPGRPEPMDEFEELPLRNLLMEAAWLRDELEKRRSLLPERAVELRAQGDRVPELPEDFEGIPVQDVFDWIRTHAGTSLFTLQRLEIAAPQKVDLAVCWLLETGAIQPVEVLSTRKEPTTAEFRAEMLLDATVDHLLHEVENEADPTLRILLLAQPQAWPELMAIFDAVPGADSTSAWVSLRDQLALRRGGSTTLQRGGATLSVVVQVLEAGTMSRIAAILPLCNSVGLWLGTDGQSSSELESLVRHLDRGAGPSSKVVIAAREGLAESLTGGGRGWKVCPAAPRSLIAVLQLFD